LTNPENNPEVCEETSSFETEQMIDPHFLRYLKTQLKMSGTIDLPMYIPEDKEGDENFESELAQSIVSYFELLKIDLAIEREVEDWCKKTGKNDKWWYGNKELELKRKKILESIDQPKCASFSILMSPDSRISSFARYIIIIQYLHLSSGTEYYANNKLKSNIGFPSFKGIKSSHYRNSSSSSYDNYDVAGILGFILNVQNYDHMRKIELLKEVIKDLKGFNNTTLEYLFGENAEFRKMWKPKKPVNQLMYDVASEVEESTIIIEEDLMSPEELSTYLTAELAREKRKNEGLAERILGLEEQNKDLLRQLRKSEQQHVTPITSIISPETDKLLDTVYRRFAHLFHPDKGGTKEQFQEFKELFEQLRRKKS